MLCRATSPAARFRASSKFLAAFHLHRECADIVHDGLAAFGANDRQACFQARLLATLDGFLKYVEFFPGKLLKLLKAALLLGIVLGQGCDRADVLLNLHDGRVVRLQVCILAGQDKAALACFGVREHQLDVLQFLQHFVGLNHPAVRLGQPLDGPVGLSSHGADDQQPQDERDGELRSEFH